MAVLDFLNHPVTQCALLVVVLAVLLAGSFWGLRRFRDYIVQNQSNSQELLTNYREMYEQGIISDAEYRTIKGRLNARMRQELRDSDGNG